MMNSLKRIYKPFLKSILYLVLITILNFNTMAATINQRIETPEYKVIKKFDRIEIRQYPDLVTASTIMGNSYSGNSGNGPQDEILNA